FDRRGEAERPDEVGVLHEGPVGGAPGTHGVRERGEQVCLADAEAAIEVDAAARRPPSWPSLARRGHPSGELLEPLEGDDLARELRIGTIRGERLVREVARRDESAQQAVGGDRRRAVRQRRRSWGLRAARGHGGPGYGQ